MPWSEAVQCAVSSGMMIGRQRGSLSCHSRPPSACMPILTLYKSP